MLNANWDVNDCLQSYNNFDVNSIINKEIQSPYIEFHSQKTQTISIIGLGYVGVVTSACLCDMGHSVIGVDLDQDKILAINNGLTPIVEKGLEDALQRGHLSHKLSATHDLDYAIANSNVTFVSVSTPSNSDGSCNLDYLEKATISLAESLLRKDSFHVIVFRSTIPPTTTQNRLIPLIEKVSKKVCGKDFGVCFNPEFLRESTAIEDFYRPAKTLIGASDSISSNIVKSIYGNIEGTFFDCSIETAEFVKYLDNTWHALKVSFANEFGRLCKSMNTDSHEVMKIFCSDTKLNISSHYLMPGFAFGGSCLPKDTRGICHLAKYNNIDLPIMSHINVSNQIHIEHGLALIQSFNSKKISLIGLTFKSGTDDLRESPSLVLLEKLVKQRYQVKCFDPHIKPANLKICSTAISKKVSDTFTSDVNELLGSELIVVLHKADYVDEIIKCCTDRNKVIDLVRLDNIHKISNYNGICW